MKLSYCLLACVLLKIVCCLQKQANLMDPESLFDIQRGPPNYQNTEKNFFRIMALTERNIVQCLFCNFIILNKYMIEKAYFTKDRLLQCSYFSPEKCLSFFENYLNESEGEKSGKHKRQFDEIDRTDAGFSTLNQMH